MKSRSIVLGIGRCTYNTGSEQFLVTVWAVWAVRGEIAKGSALSASPCFLV